MSTFARLNESIETIIDKVKSNLETILIVLTIILFILLIFRLTAYVYHIVTLSLMFAIMAVAWNILATAGPVSLGHAAFFGLGAYFTYFAMAKWGLSSYPALAVAVLVSIAASLLLGYITFRFGVTGIYFALVTIAFAEVLRELFISFREITGGSLGVFLPVTETSPLYFIYDSKMPYYYFIIVAYLIFYAVVKYKLRRFMRILGVIGNDELTATSMGINIMKYKTLALALSSSVTSIMGWFYIHYFRYITPNVAFGLLTSTEIVTIGLVGGLNIVGALIAALLLIPLGEELRALWGAKYAGLNLLIYGIILMVVVIFRSLRARRR